MQRRPSARARDLGRDLERRQRAPRIAPGFARDEVAHLVGDVERNLAEPALGVGERAIDELRSARLVERLEPHHLAAGEQAPR